MEPWNRHNSDTNSEDEAVWFNFGGTGRMAPLEHERPQVLESMLSGTEDVALDFGAEDQRARRLRHPLAVVFHLLFRVAAILTYLFCGWVGSSFVANFVIVVFLLSMDFWTVKNVTGRLLVGLRWWNRVDDDGTSQWVYEARKTSDKSSTAVTESRLFWLSLVTSQIIWVTLFFVTVFGLKISWLIVVLIANIMNGANLYGYLRCKYGNKKNLGAVASNFLGQQVLKSMISSGSKKSEAETTERT